MDASPKVALHAVQASRSLKLIEPYFQEAAMAKEIKHFTDEADIGSGEKNRAQREIEQDVTSIPQRGQVRDGRQIQDVVEEQQYADERSTLGGYNLQDAERERMIAMQAGQPAAQDASQVLQKGTHIARITTARLPDGMYEAQVYVRLTREPEIAETYIPAGAYPTESDARTAAEERARRALDEHEF
jgi:hypothetical protein